MSIQKYEKNRIIVITSNTYKYAENRKEIAEEILFGFILMAGLGLEP